MEHLYAMIKKAISTFQSSTNYFIKRNRKLYVIRYIRYVRYIETLAEVWENSKLRTRKHFPCELVFAHFNLSKFSQTSTNSCLYNCIETRKMFSDFLKEN